MISFVKLITEYDIKRDRRLNIILLVSSLIIEWTKNDENMYNNYFKYYLFDLKIYRVTKSNA